jgi:hypothetical protein
MSNFLILWNFFPEYLNEIDLKRCNAIVKGVNRIAFFTGIDSFYSSLEIPECFKNHSFFLSLAQSLTENGYVTRSTFPMLTDKQYRLHVRDSKHNFCKFAHGKYMLNPLSNLDTSLQLFFKYMQYCVSQSGVTIHVCKTPRLTHKSKAEINKIFKDIMPKNVKLEDMGL